MTSAYKILIILIHVCIILTLYVHDQFTFVNIYMIIYINYYEVICYI